MFNESNKKIQVTQLFALSSFGVLALVFFQLILGALMIYSSSYAETVCGAGLKNIVSCFDMLAGGSLPETNQVWLNFSFRFYEVIVILGVFTLGHFLFWRTPLKKTAIGLCALISIQVLSGLLFPSSPLQILLSVLLLVLCALIYFKLLGEKTIAEQWECFKDIVSLTKPRLSGLVIITAGLGMGMAPGAMSTAAIWVTLISISMIVAGACTINCYMEREGDKLMERTSVRPLPSGRLDEGFAFWFGIALMVIFTPVIALSSNLLTAGLGALACVLYIFLYTPLKRKTTLSLFAGAIPGALPPLMGWTSVTNSIDAMGLVLFGVLFVWQLPHFLAISLFRLNEYKNAGIKILPVTRGIKTTKVRIALYTVILMLISLLPAIWEVKSTIYIVLVFACGFAFTLYSFLGFKEKDSWEASRLWARSYFFGSLIYLPSVLTLMMIYQR